MSEKVANIQKLVEKIEFQLSDTPQDWMKFLSVSANLYKYSFYDKLLIYAQKPNATACTTLQKWNDPFHCRVKAGSKGIALLRNKNGYPKLEYVFDISDVIPMKEAEKPQLWKLEKDFETAVLNSFSLKYGKATSSHFSEALLDFVQRAVKNMDPEYFSYFLSQKKDSSISYIQNYTFRSIVFKLITASVQFTILTRCGIDTHPYFNEESFLGIKYFQNTKLFYGIGQMISILSRQVLKEIESIVKNKNMDIEKVEISEDTHYNQQIEMQQLERLIDNLRGGNKDVRQTITKENVNSRGNGNHLPSGGGLSNAGLETEQAKRHRTLWENEAGLHEKTRQFEHGNNDNEGRTEQLSSGNQRTGLRQNRPVNGADGEESRSERGIESRRSNKVGTGNEQLQGNSGGNRERRADLQLNSAEVKPISLPTENTANKVKDTKEAKEHSFASFFVATNEQQKKEKKKPLSHPEQNYKLFCSLFPDIATGKYRYMKLQAGTGFMPLNIAMTGKNELAIAHTYIQSGDLMNDPEMTFRINHEKKTLEPLTYQQDGLGIYQNVYPEKGKYIPGLQKDLNSFTKQWLQNIKNQNYLPQKAIQRMNDIDEEILFDESGKPVTELNVINQNDINKTPLEISEENNINPFIVTETDNQAKAIPVGAIVEINNQEYEIETVDYVNNEVELRNITSQNIVATFYRTETIENTLSLLQKNTLIPLKEENGIADIQQPNMDGQNNTLTQIEKSASAPLPVTSNFQIKENNLGVGGPKAKFNDNILAIQTLKQIEAESRPATPSEQEILSKYVGWGGLSYAFDGNNEKWRKEYVQLKELLTESEYNAARNSALNAYYTPPIIIKAIYQTLQQTGLQKGKILEPSCGTGHFFGLLPESMKDLTLYGVELDSLTGRIAQQLYPKANIAVSGFEKTSYPDNYFDMAVGNIPFGSYKIPDGKYNHLNFRVHDYFIAKTLDNVRTDGIVALITSKGVLDKPDTKVREYLAKKADLLGAVRLPNNAFYKNAGTDVTADILFFKKRETPPVVLPEWVQVGKNNEGIPINRYFLENPHMVLGKMSFWANMYGDKKNTACLPFENADLSKQLEQAFSRIQIPEIPERKTTKEEKENIPNIVYKEEMNLKNFSYHLIDGQLYYRENQLLKPVNANYDARNRIAGMIELRDCTRQLLVAQINNFGDDELSQLQENLNQKFDSFIKKYGFLHSKENKKAFKDDTAYPLLCSLEILNENKTKLIRKADLFYKRTIKPHTPVTHVQTAQEALIVSINEKACVDLGFMASLMGGSQYIETIKQELKGLIFKNPMMGNDPFVGWETADEYLSGNVRKKLEIAEESAQKDNTYLINVEQLRQVQPEDLAASDIEVHIGSAWVDRKYYEQFMYEILETIQKKDITLEYSPYTNHWHINNKKLENYNILVTSTYGTGRINAYEILEKILNLQDIVIRDSTKNEKGETITVVNEQETSLALEKQEALQQEFQKWIWKEPERRETLCRKYNTLFNNIRPRQYDGSHLFLEGMNPEIHLRSHQSNAVARMLFGGNTLLAHAVGAGKTFEMIAAAMESKRLRLCSKSLFVVPNHIIEQWGADFLNLYPNANILIASEKDFEKKNRQEFCSKIATGNFDAVIIGHSQFGKIPISPEWETAIIENEIENINFALEMAKKEDKKSYSVKQLEKTRLSLLSKLDNSRKRLLQDDVVTFEQLGVDRLFIDEAHEFKNLYVFSKMQNVSGIASNSDVQKTKDMYAKCQYINEITQGKGIVFATGTPVTNSIAELYTMMRYLQYDTLQALDMTFFDNWVSNFGQKVTAMEIKPEGKGFQIKTRLARFFNLPELTRIWKESADVITADMLTYLDRPEAEYINVLTKATEQQKYMVQQLGVRADRIRKKQVSRYTDNMLAITGDGRKLALDQRAIAPYLPDDPNSKVNAVVKNVYENWKNSTVNKGTQLIFSDMSVPGGSMSYCVYEDIKQKLIKNGIPEQEIAFIHDAGDDEVKKEALFAKVRAGQVRILIGSTSKMGAGTNIQDRLVALHHVDCPWKPGDLEQREGRILRQGNQNVKVKIYRYVTEGTFDAYNWSVVERKQRFISQIMTSKSPARSCEDIDATELSYAEVKAICAGDERIKEMFTLESDLKALKLKQSNYYKQYYQMQDNLNKHYPKQLQHLKTTLEELEKDNDFLNQSINSHSGLTILGASYESREKAETAIQKACEKLKAKEAITLGNYNGFKIILEKNPVTAFSYYLTLQRTHNYTIEFNPPELNVVPQIRRKLKGLPKWIESIKQEISNLEKSIRITTTELEKPFAHEQELKEKNVRFLYLQQELDKLNQNPDSILDTNTLAEGEVGTERLTDGKEKPSVLKQLSENKQKVLPSVPSAKGEVCL